MPSKKEFTRIDQLTADPKNARIHTGKNIEMLAAGLQEVGAGRSILIDANGEIIAGHGVCEAAVAAGLTKLRVVDAEGDELIAVRRSDLKGRKKTRAALLDNRAQETSSWNTDVLQDLAHSDLDILKGLWDKDELDFLLETPSGLPEDPLPHEMDKQKLEESDVERVVLWLPRARHAEFQTNVRTLGERAATDDVGEVILWTLNSALDNS